MNFMAGARMDYFAPLNVTPHVSFDVRITLADHLAFEEHVRGTRAQRHARQNLMILALGLTPIVALFVIGLVRVALIGSGYAIDDLLDSDGRGPFFTKVFLELLGLGALLMGAAHLSRRRWTRRRLATVLRRETDVDADDPDLPCPARISAHVGFISVASRTLNISMNWQNIHACDETPDHMFLLFGSRGAGIIVPKRDVAPAKILALRDLARHAMTPHLTAAPAQPRAAVTIWG